jgi:hypothetical protein
MCDVCIVLGYVCLGEHGFFWVGFGFVGFHSDGFFSVVMAVGGIMGFAKSGSNTSLVAGGGSALILYYVFLNLPTKPIMSSIIGLGKL